MSYRRRLVATAAFALTALCLGVPTAHADLTGNVGAKTQPGVQPPHNNYTGSGAGSSSSCGAAAGCNIYDIFNGGAPLDWGPITTDQTQLLSQSPQPDTQQLDIDLSNDVRSNQDSSAVTGSVPLSPTAWGYDVHCPDGTGTLCGDNTVIGWTIEIWRQGEPTPIFQRRICLHAQDFEGHSDYNNLWLDCGVATPSATSDGGGEFSTSPSDSPNREAPPPLD